MFKIPSKRKKPLPQVMPIVYPDHCQPQGTIANPAANILIAEFVLLYHSRLMNDVRIIRDRLPEEMRDQDTGKFPILDDIYGTLGLMRRCAESLRNNG